MINLKTASFALALFMFPALRAEAEFQGTLDQVDQNTMVGWAWDSANPKQTIEVVLEQRQTISVPSIKKITVVANQFRPDLLAAGIGSGRHGFSVQIPEEWKSPASRYLILATFAGTEQRLWGENPANVIMGAAPEGYMDSADCNIIAGWAWDAYKPDLPVTGYLEVKKVSDNSNFRDYFVVASEYRADLEAAGKGNGQHSFAFPTPDELKDGADYEIKFFLNSVLWSTNAVRLNCPS